ncbi:MAG: hypothetical protein LBR91_02490 [Puniceicoccales bacterium]|jgi:hypothetical protein|nr:hypothetical protein [Puniceicoccales bacterium]
MVDIFVLFGGFAAETVNAAAADSTAGVGVVVSGARGIMSALRRSCASSFKHVANLASRTVVLPMAWNASKKALEFVSCHAMGIIAIVQLTRVAVDIVDCVCDWRRKKANRAAAAITNNVQTQRNNAAGDQSETAIAADDGNS